MIIGIDAAPLDRPSSRRRGIGMYSKRLIEALSLKNESLGNPHRFLLTRLNRMGVTERDEVIVLPSIRKPSRFQWLLDRWTVPRFLKRHGVEVFHATDFLSVPASKTTKVLAHVHDMIPFIYWKQYSDRFPVDMQWVFRQARKRVHYAERIITDSLHSKQDIAELTGYPEQRIHVVYFGPAAASLKSKTTSDQESKGVPLPPYFGHQQGESYPYFLYVGGTDFRKNLPFLIRCFSAFSEKHSEVKLLLVGETFLMRKLAEVDEIYAEIERLGLHNRVQMTGYVNETLLQLLYRRSIALLFPSLYEGFGLPVLEAMAAGAPVVAARASSIPEILGDTGLYFDPYKEDSLITAMGEIYANDLFRSDCIERARQRAKLFSWENAAQQIFQIYEEL